MAEELKDYREWQLQRLADPKRAARFLNAAYQDSPAMFLKALRKVAQARQPIKRVAEDAGITREYFYKVTSETGNPSLDVLIALLKVVGITPDFRAIGAEIETPTPVIPSSTSHGYSPRRKRNVSTQVSGQQVLPFGELAINTSAATVGVGNKFDWANVAVPALRPIVDSGEIGAVEPLLASLVASKANVGLGIRF
jgi:probable addiction module antidote protein